MWTTFDELKEEAYLCLCAAAEFAQRSILSQSLCRFLSLQPENWPVFSFFFFLRKIRLLCITSCNEEREKGGKKGKVDFTGNDDAAVWKSFCLIKKKKKTPIVTKQLQNNSCKYSLVEQICNEEFNWLCPRCFQMFSVRKSSWRNSIRTCCESVSRHELDWVIFSSFHPNMTVNMPEKFYGKF